MADEKTSTSAPDRIDRARSPFDGDSSGSTPAPTSRRDPVVRAGRRRGPRIIALGSGKGGVGRSVIAVNIGVHLAQIGKRVLLIDADHSCANLHSLLGVTPPIKGPADTFYRKRDSFDEIILDTVVPGLGLITGFGETPSQAPPGRVEGRSRFLDSLEEIDQDYVIIDLPAGISPSILDLFLFADCGIVVFQPEPTSVENAYRFIKQAFFRRVWHEEHNKSLRGLVSDALAASREFGILSPPAFLDHVWQRFPDLAPSLEEDLANFQPRFLLNQCRTRSDMDMGEAIISVVRRKLQIELGFLGAVEYDDSIRLSVRKRRPVVLEFPEGKPADNFQQVVRRLLTVDLNRFRRR